MEVDEDVGQVLFADCKGHWADDCAEERELRHEEGEAYGVVELRVVSWDTCCGGCLLSWLWVWLCKEQRVIRGVCKE